MAQFKPFPFDPVHDAALLNAAGYSCEHYPATWQDIGGPENGPKLIGGPAFNEWRNGDHIIVVSEGEVVAVERHPVQL